MVVAIGTILSFGIHYLQKAVAHLLAAHGVQAPLVDVVQGLTHEESR